MEGDARQTCGYWPGKFPAVIRKDADMFRSWAEESAEWAPMVIAPMIVLGIIIVTEPKRPTLEEAREQYACTREETFDHEPSWRYVSRAMRPDALDVSPSTWETLLIEHNNVVIDWDDNVPDGLTVIIPSECPGSPPPSWEG